ncbi:hypothetical protein KSS87_004376, partial [Heliosperma pusillum]
MRGVSEQGLELCGGRLYSGHLRTRCSWTCGGLSCETARSFQNHWCGFEPQERRPCPKDCEEKKISDVITELTDVGANYTFECIGLAFVMQDAFDSVGE